MSDEQRTNSIKDRILSQMVSKREEDQSFVKKILNEHFDDAKAFFTIREQDGRVTIETPNRPVEEQILSYLIGAAYAKIADLREDDAVSNSELAEELKLGHGTLTPSITRLRQKGLIVRKTEGMYRVEYRKVSEALASLSGEANPRRVTRRSTETDNVFEIYSDLGKEGLRDFLETRSEVQLKDIIKVHRLDSSGQSLKWTGKNRLADFVAERIESRSEHGSVFLAQPITKLPRKSTQRHKVPVSQGGEDASLPPKGTVGILELANKDVRFPESAFGSLTFEEAIALLLLEVGVPLTPIQIANLISRGFKKVRLDSVRAYLNQDRRKLRKYVIREGDGYRLTGEGVNWVRNVVIPKMSQPKLQD